MSAVSVRTVDREGAEVGLTPWREYAVTGATVAYRPAIDMNDSDVHVLTLTVVEVES